MKGYAGKILRIDLSTGRTRVEPLSPEMARDYIGGRGLAARILYDELPAGVDPLGPGNRVVVASGPLSGTLVPAAGRTVFAARSPATGGWGDANVGGHLAGEMKYAGYDAIILEGSAAKPVYVYVKNDTVEIRDAAPYWGRGTAVAERALKDDLGEEFQIGIIGPAGENRVAFAGVNHDFGRQAARTGMGAVLGSKNVKAIAVRGTKSVPLADVARAIAVGKRMMRVCLDAPNLAERQRYGTSQAVKRANDIGYFPTRNFQSSALEGHESLGHEVMRREIVINDKACFTCPQACGKYARAKTDRYDVYVEGPEYETTALIGGNCAITDIRDVAYLNYVCDELGLDTISAGGVIGFAMECFEKGIITREDTGGVEAVFGSVEAFAELARKISYREGIGNVLAEGVRSASRVFGHGSDRFAIHMKGLEWTGQESRGAPYTLLGYMTCDVGAHHNRHSSFNYDISIGRDVFEGKARRLVELQHIRPTFDNLGVCRFQWGELDLDFALYAEALEAATGTSYGVDGMTRVAERVWNLTRLFWIKHLPGFGRKDDMPPARIMEEPVVSGPTAGRFIPADKLNRMLDEYYTLRGWDANGHPTPQKLAELGL